MRQAYSDPMKNPLATLSNKGRYAAAFAAGALSVLAMPPVGFFPVLLLTVPAFIYLSAQTEGRRSSFFTGWAFGAGYLIFGFYWISAALFVDIKAWAWVLPFSLIVGPGIMGMYYGFVPLLCRRMRGHSAYPFIFIAFWSMAEYARGHLFTGFPWNLPGYAWDRVLPVMQTSSLIGIYGLSLLTLFWAAAPAYRKQKIMLALAVLSFAAALFLGTLRLMNNPTTPFENYTVRIVQAHIPQEQKWDNQQQWRNFEKFLDLTRAENIDGKTPDFVVWPETAVAADLALFPNISQHIGNSLGKESIAILGNLRFAKTEGKQEYFNSVAVIDSRAVVLSTYDKHHLVPFGEYIPYREHIRVRPIAQALSGVGDFTPGPGPQTLTAGKMPRFSPLICYEVIFPGAVADPNNRPDWLVNVTNDAWYGHTAGPYQHLAISRMRAVEEGLPLARAANTGISAMVDPLGRIVAEKALGDSGFIDVILPRPLAATFYSRFKDLPFLVLLAALILLPQLRNKKQKNN
jgi:apolipoprotein N-acyltransferase